MWNLGLQACEPRPASVLISGLVFKQRISKSSGHAMLFLCLGVPPSTWVCLNPKVCVVGSLSRLVFPCFSRLLAGEAALGGACPSVFRLHTLFLLWIAFLCLVWFAKDNISGFSCSFSVFYCIPLFFLSLCSLIFFPTRDQTQTQLEHARIRELEQSLLFEKTQAEKLLKGLEATRVIHPLHLVPC